MLNLYIPLVILTSVEYYNRKYDKHKIRGIDASPVLIVLSEQDNCKDLL